MIKHAMIINPFRRRSGNKQITAAAYTKRYREWATLNCTHCNNTRQWESVQGSPSYCDCCGTFVYTCFYCLIHTGHALTVCGDCNAYD